MNPNNDDILNSNISTLTANTRHPTDHEDRKFHRMNLVKFIKPTDPLVGKSGWVKQITSSQVLVQVYRVSRGPFTLVWRARQDLQIIILEETLQRIPPSFLEDTGNSDSDSSESL